MKSGIYKIVRKANGSEKLYIGSAVNIQHRFNQHRHLLRNGSHFNRHLQSSWNKHGESAFSFEVIEEVAKEVLIQKEQFYLDLLKPFSPNGFNIRKVAERNTGVKFTDEVRRKVSNSLKQYYRTHDAHNKGIKYDDDFRDKVSKATRGKHIGTNNHFYGKTHTLEVRKMLSEFNYFAKLNKDQVLEMRCMYESGSYKIKDLATIFNVSDETVRRVIKRLTWKYI